MKGEHTWRLLTLRFAWLALALFASAARLSLNETEKKLPAAAQGALPMKENEE